MTWKTKKFFPPCPLCYNQHNEAWHQDEIRDYYRCCHCELIFVPSSQFLPETAEKSHYDHHQNSPTDMRYRTFLNNLCLPLQERLTPNSHGLDFGSGPGPTLSHMLEEFGHRVTLYDHFYFPNPSALQQSYDFITATEVVEHLHNPAGGLTQLWTLLKPGGYLGLMTSLVGNPSAFADWHYIKDPTHVCFFSRNTFDWLSKQWRAELTFLKNNVILFHKPVHFLVQ